ncbi:MAG: UDP-3-O-[3-hydroxymyristoyl] N-acetylglucosamine deacetylase [Candidatus Cloacimonetes bacterium 4572_65]|nr:MAG: UDP-3-O-[3-hydroxymyristoyl] N-acetylglucosamine deacetylase [Candidatus Cloacimonetes bacterium 4572_65]
MEYKKTIAGTTSYTGIGLHSGEITTITFKPAGKDDGISFIRVDLPGRPVIPADIEHVVDIARGTTIGISKATVGTIEHLLAAIRGVDIDNINIEINGPEVPVADGSAYPFIKLMKEVGTLQQDSEREYFEIDKPISFSAPEENVDIVIVPANELKVTFLIDYQHPHLGTQYTWLPNMSYFEEEFSKARTFCFINEILYLKEKNLIKGGSLDNAVVIAEPNMSEGELENLRNVFNYHREIEITEEGVLNSASLRYNNEFVRHKVLDVIGDIALLGMPIKGHILAARSGHKTNVELVRKLRSIQRKNELQKMFQKKRTEDIVFDINAIMKILPHRYPFLFVDKIIEFVPGKYIIGTKNVTMNEPFFQGHFPDHPVMPGVLIVEAMAQTGGIMLLNQLDDPENYVAYFASINNVKFRKPVLPGDILRFELKVLSLKKTITKMHGDAYVGSTKVCEGDFLAKIMKK